jgi:C-terminal processing protease CtpA/Prc
VFDYTNSLLYLKSNEFFKEPFEHDMSGIEYYIGHGRVKHLFISRVEPGSPADVGLAKDDEIVSINFKPVAKMSIEEIDGFFKTRERSLLLDIFHDKKYDRVIIYAKAAHISFFKL